MIVSAANIVGPGCYYPSVPKTKEAMAEYQRQYRAKNRERLNAAALANYYANRDERNRKMREHYRAKKAEYLERAKQWALANPEKAKAAKAKHATSERGRANRRKDSARRNDWKRNAPGSCNEEQRAGRIAMFGGKFWVPGCGKPFDTMDHVIPLARGGSHWPANLRPICNHHNAAKGARDWRLMLGG